MEDLDQLISSGNSPSALARQLVRYLRNCLMAKLGGENSALLAIAYDERARAARTALLFSEEDLTRNLQIALRTFDELNYRQEQRFHLELGLLKLIQAQRLLPVEEILSGLATQSGTRRVPASTSQPTRPAQAQQAPARPASQPPAPTLSPFAASTQRAAEVPVSRPIRETATASIIPVSSSPASTSPDAFTASAPIAPAPSLSLVPEIATATAGALALAEPVEESAPAAETGPQIVPPLAAASENSEEIRNAVAQALSSGGHATAAVLIEDGKWIIEGSSVRIEVNAKATMIRLTFNAAAEKIIRQALSQAGAPSRFLIVSGEGLTSSGAAPRVRAPLGSIENEARNHPLVAQAQTLFNAEIVSVVDLREK